MGTDSMELRLQIWDCLDTGNLATCACASSMSIVYLHPHQLVRDVLRGLECGFGLLVRCFTLISHDPMIIGHPLSVMIPIAHLWRLLNVKITYWSHTMDA